MRMPFNPFFVFVVVAVVVVVVIAVISRRRTGTQTLAVTNGTRATTGPSVAVTLAIVLAVAVILIPCGIAIAALWGPSVGFFACFALLVGGLIALALSRRSRREAARPRRSRAEDLPRTSDDLRP
jgi:uncharacterized membrane protein YdjX (TVP38/TMEM64 family)